MSVQNEVCCTRWGPPLCLLHVGDSSGRKYHAHVLLGLTLAGGHRLSQAPSPVGLAADDPLASVVVARVTDEHQLGLELVLGLKDEPPPAMLHADAADIGAGHSWGDTEQGRESAN